MTDKIDAMIGEDDETPEQVEDTTPEQDEPEQPGAAAGEDEGDGEQEDDRRVPLAALHEARNEARALKEEIERLRRDQDDAKSRQQKIDEVLAQLRKEREQPEKTAPAIPKFEEDPDGFYKGTIEQLRSELAEIKNQGQQRQQVEEQSQESQQLLERYAASVRQFKSTARDWDDAYQFLGQAIDKDLEARGYDDPMERARMIQYEEGAMVGRALKAGKSPAEIIYNYAKTKGWKGAQVTDENKIERIQKGAKAAKSLSGPKGSGEAPMNLERLLELAKTDPQAFDREWAKAERQGILG